jgi:GMP synthase-like glutamine amidotransferase
MAPWEQNIVMLTSQYSSIHTRNVVVEGIGIIALTTHDENGLFEHRPSVGGTQCEPPVKITLQEELLTEKMRRMYPCAVDIKVECKSGYLRRLVYGSMHIRTRNVGEARESKPSGPATTNEPVCERLKSVVQFV